MGCLSLLLSTVLLTMVFAMEEWPCLIDSRRTVVGKQGFGITGGIAGDMKFSHDNKVT